MNPFFPCPAQAPPPIFNQQTRYVYRTRDGGPPDMGKPPAPSGPPFGFPGMPPPGMMSPGPPPFGFPPPPGPPPPGPFWSGAPPPPPGPPGWSFQPPPSAAPTPSHMCFQNSSGTTCFPTNSAPPASSSAAVSVTTTTTPATFNAANYKGPICTAGGTTAASASTPSGPAPGNRVNERLVKADDGSGVLLSPDQTGFHVLEPGQRFGPHMSHTALVKDVAYKVQYADSDWTVEKVMELLGAAKIERTGRKYYGHRELVGIQEWIPDANRQYFQEGSVIMLNDPKAKQTLREVGWGPDRGRAGQRPPVWVMLYPVKEPGD